ncbi:MAG: coproporphyrinogen-III oxidase family protein, partial [Alphaproteobacteria bacterium]
GGTPSLMDPDTVAAVISRARRHRPRSSEPVEITLEANPTSVEADRFRAYAEAGINRLSLGVQSLDDAALAFLCRRHSVAQAEAAIGLAAATFPRWSFDLIYARPDQTAAGWRAELTRALAFGADHLSLYQLTLEPGTPFHGEYSAGRLTPLDGDAAAHLYDVTAEMTAAAGLPAYEISNHARPGQEGRHNLVYWRSGQWVGVGPGAHSRLTDAAGQRLARRRHRAPEAWLAAVEADGHATRDESLIPSGDAFDEALMMGLRLAEGVPLSRLARLGGADRCDGLVRSPAMAGLMDLGFLAWRNDRDGRRLTATPAGRLALDSVLARLLA